jgi:hypothetical protein
MNDCRWARIVMLCLLGFAVGFAYSLAQPPPVDLAKENALLRAQIAELKKGEVGRYQVAVWKDRMVFVDTKVGALWGFDGKPGAKWERWTSPIYGAPIQPVPTAPVLRVPVPNLPK